MASILNKKLTKYVVVLFLIIITIIAYSGIVDNGFINYDDPGYITKNKNVQSGVSLETIIWAFKSTVESNWHPLTWISHAVDYTLFGLNPKYHHIMNLFLHILSTIILFITMQEVTSKLWQSVFIAVVFAIHPLHVESVAWAAERKDVLSGFFWMLTLFSYLKYRKSPSYKKYLVTLAFFMLGLLAKPMLVTLPFVLVLLDYWLKLTELTKNQMSHTKKVNEFTFLKKSIYEKIPFFILSIGSSIVTYYVQKHGGSMAGYENLSFTVRLENAFVSYINYILKALIPHNLTIFYPHPENSLKFWQVGGSIIILCTLTVFMWKNRVKHPYLIVGWFWFLGTLFPVIGLVQVGLQSMADRYMYIPLIGLTIIIAYIIPRLLMKLVLQKYILLFLYIVSIVLMVTITRSQVAKWKDSFTLFEHSLKVTENNHIAYNNLGVALTDSGKYEEAISYLHEALRIRPNEALIHSNLARAFLLQGNLKEALNQYKWVSERVRDDPVLYSRIATILADEGNIGEAIKYYKLANLIDPNNPDIYCKLSELYIEEGNYEIAKQQCLDVLKIKPNFAKAHNILGIIAGKQHLYDEAIKEFSMAIFLDSTDSEAYYDFGILYERLNNDAMAIEMYEKAILFNPNHIDAHFNIGVLFAKQGSYGEAEMHWKKVLNEHPKSVDTRLNLARLYKIQERFDDSIKQLSEILRVDSNNVTASYNIANLYMQIGKYPIAEMYYKNVLKIDPTFSSAKDSLKKLKLLFTQ